MAPSECRLPNSQGGLDKHAKAAAKYRRPSVDNWDRWSTIQFIQSYGRL